jgi:hypothetical protein
VLKALDWVRGMQQPALTWCLQLVFAVTAGSRYLSSDISYFGVGSKNAAFYLGRTVKVVTKTQDSAYVHELCIQGELLVCCITRWPISLFQGPSAAAVVCRLGLSRMEVLPVPLFACLPAPVAACSC